jgi:hypothetical protein
VLGDSHAHGYAEELLHHVKQHFTVTVYVKPNAGLTELLNSAKEETSKLTKKDTVIVLGGLMILREICVEKNLTSIQKFLNAKQHTNVTLIDVPLRYDLGKRPYINEEIMNYNRKIHTVNREIQEFSISSSNNQ